MATLTLRDVLKATNGAAQGLVPDLEFNQVCTDTRSLVPGSLFVALKGPRFDGHQFLRQAFERGARAAVVSRPLPASELPFPQIRVENSEEALGNLASYSMRRFPARRVAITGSNGKTTTKDLLRAALAASGETVASEHSYNNSIGVPMTLFQIGPQTRFAAIELGTNHPGEIAHLAALAAPEVGIVTNCTHAHVQFLGDLDGVVREKGALIESLPKEGAAVLNADDPSFPQLRERARCRVISFGIRQRADFRASDIRFDLSRVHYLLNGSRVLVPIGGCHNVYNSLAALAAADAVGVPVSRAIPRLRKIEGPPMRLSLVRTPRLSILDDCYNANPGSVEAGFRTLAAVHVPGRKVVILGDMLELGGQSHELHRAVGRLMSLSDFALLVVVGRFADSVVEGALERGFPQERIRRFEDAANAARSIASLVQPGDTVLVKGSRGMTLEIVVEELLKLGGARAG